MAQYHLTSSGEMGAAPVVTVRARSSPIIRRTFASTSRSHSRNRASSRRGTGRPSMR